MMMCAEGYPDRQQPKHNRTIIVISEQEMSLEAGHNIVGRFLVYLITSASFSARAGPLKLVAIILPAGSSRTL